MNNKINPLLALGILAALEHRPIYEPRRGCGRYTPPQVQAKQKKLRKIAKASKRRNRGR